uniref:Uncharacterized protein n=1 Tax=Globodera rostochiensis TaxID=31243 RepID=A0A914GUK4_GLORO
MPFCKIVGTLFCFVGLTLVRHSIGMASEEQTPGAPTDGVPAAPPATLYKPKPMAADLCKMIGLLDYLYASKRRILIEAKKRQKGKNILIIEPPNLHSLKSVGRRNCNQNAAKKEESIQTQLLLSDAIVLREIIQANLYFVGIPAIDNWEEFNKHGKILFEKIDQFAENASECSVMKRISLNLRFIAMSLEKDYKNYCEFFAGLEEQILQEMCEFYQFDDNKFNKYRTNALAKNANGIKPTLLYYFFFSTFYRKLMANINLTKTRADRQLLHWLYSIEKALDRRMAAIVAERPRLPLLNASIPS